MHADYDAIVIGAGHNGLVCAAYLAQAGERVLVLERHAEPGGCVATEEAPGYPGFGLDVGGLEHGAFSGSAALRELELDRFGLRYLQRDHIFTFAFPGQPGWLLDKDPDRTRRSIAAISPRDAEAWSRFGEFCSGILRLLGAVGDGPPPSLAALANLSGAGGRRTNALMQTFLASPRQVVDRWFEHDAVRAGLLNYATHAQTPPWQLGSGYAPCLALGGQGHGGNRPAGGGRALIRALVACIEHHGGTVRCGQPVRRIVVRERRAVGVELEHGEQISARRAIIPAIDARRVFTALIEPEHLPSGFRRSMETLTSARDNIGELSMACVLDRLPVLAGPHGGPEAVSGTVWQSGGVAEVEETFLDIRRGVLPAQPCIMWSIPSVVDPGLAPPGSHVFWLAAFLPYAFKDGRNWDERKEEVADHLLASIDRVAPGLAASVGARIVLSPVDWERRTGNTCGNADHLDTSIDQMLGNRPSPALSGYRTPIRGLYLSGAGTHPGGGITGNPGRNTARVVLRDLGLLERPGLAEIQARLTRARGLASAALTMRKYL